MRGSRRERAERVVAPPHVPGRFRQQGQLHTAVGPAHWQRDLLLVRGHRFFLRCCCCCSPFPSLRTYTAAAPDAPRHGHRADVEKVAWNGNGLWLLTASRDQTCCLTDVRTMRAVSTFRDHDHELTSATWHPTVEDAFVVGTRSGSLVFWSALECVPACQCRPPLPAMRALHSQPAPTAIRGRLPSCAALTRTLCGTWPSIRTGRCWRARRTTSPSSFGASSGQGTR